MCRLLGTRLNTVGIDRALFLVTEELCGLWQVIKSLWALGSLCIKRTSPRPL